MNVSNSDQVFLKMIHIILYFNVRLFEKGFETSKWLLRHRGIGAGWAGWARAHPLFCMTFPVKGRLPTHFFSTSRIVFGLAHPL